MKLPDASFDVVVVGGSFAGLSAATQLGRARRSVLVIDDGKPRNRFARNSHGFLTQDGVSPVEILRTAREQLSRYPTVRFLTSRATAARRGEGFEVETTEGSFEARRLVLAYGMRDLLPEVEGLKELWGTGVFHCPYCHGYELREEPLGILGNGEIALHQAMMLPDWSSDVMLFTNGPSEYDEQARQRLAKRGVTVEEGKIARLVSSGKELAAVEMADGRRIPRRGLLTATRVEPVCDLHAQLGCAMDDGPLGAYVRTDFKKETTVPGVVAAGDLARMAGGVALAVGDGNMAGSMSHQSLLAEDWS